MRSDLLPSARLLVCLGAALLSACAHNPQPESASPAAVERANQDDCEILVAIGKSELKWGEKPPVAALLRDFTAPGGATWRQDCAWKKLGVAAPRIGDAHSAMVFFVTRPSYSGTRASANFQYSVAGVRLPDGAVLPPFFEREHCSLEKQAGGWHLLGCKLIGIKP